MLKVSQVLLVIIETQQQSVFIILHIGKKWNAFWFRIAHVYKFNTDDLNVCFYLQFFLQIRFLEKKGKVFQSEIHIKPSLSHKVTCVHSLYKKSVLKFNETHMIW